MKTTTAFLLLICLHISHAQSKADKINLEAKRVYQAYVSNFTEISKNKTNKKAVVEFGKLFETGAVLVKNIFDSTKVDTIKVKSFLPFIQKTDSNTNIAFQLIKINPFKENISRNYDDCTIDFNCTKSKIMKIADSSGTRDSVLSSITFKQTMFIRFDENMASNYFGRIVAIEDAGKTPTLSKLPDLISWWVNLSADWQKIFRTKNQFPLYPSIRDLEGLPLTFELDLSNSTITDFSPISKIKELRKLNLSNTSFSDLSILDSCKYLGELNVSSTKVRELSHLNNLKSLRKLYLNNNELKSLDGIQNLKKLIELEASDNQINDLTPLVALENLEKLNLCVNKIFKIDALGKLIKLSDLRIGKNEIQGIEPLANITELIRLDIFNNNVTTLLPIKKHIKIAFLYIDFNPIKDLSPISGFGYLTQFSMSHTPITDLSPISRSTTMGYLNIAASEVASLAPLDKFNVIKEFKMFQTKISKNEAAKYAKNHPGCKITYY